MNRLLNIAAVATCLFAGTQLPGAAAEPDLPVKLTGIVMVEGMRLALFEMPVGQTRPHYIKPVLSEGERIESLEVKRIEPETGRVHVRHKGVETFYAVDEAASQNAKRTLQLNSADSRQVLDVFQQLTDRTALMDPGLPGGKVTLDITAQTRQEAATAIEAAFRKLGIELQPQAKKFTFVLQTNTLDRLARIPAPPDDPAPTTKNPASGPGDDTIPAGMIKFQDADISQFLEIYQELTGCTVLRKDRPQATKITIKTRTELSRAQVIWAFESILRLSDLAVAPKGSKFICIADAKDQGRLDTLPKVPAAAESDDQFPAGMFKFWGADLSQVLEIYQSVTKRTVLQETGPGARILAKNQTSLSRGEAVWMLDTLLALADLAAVPQGEKFVYVVRGASQPKLPTFSPNPIPEDHASKSPLPAGGLKFSNAESRTLLETYAALCGRKALEPVPASRVKLHNASELTHAEALYALEATAALNNLKLELVGDRDVRLVAAAEYRRRTPGDAR